LMRTAPAGVTRITHDPVTGQCLGVLIEPAATNLLTYSEDFTQSAWVKFGSTIAVVSTTAPDGTATVNKIIADTSSSSHMTSTSPTSTTVVGTTYTVSIYAKAAGHSFLQIRCGATSQFRCAFNLLTGEMLGLTGATATFAQLKGGWCRCSLTFVADSTSTAIRYGVMNASAQQDYTGDGTSGIFVWGAQLEAGPLTSYIKTEASQATRATDNLSMQGGNFSSWYNQAEGMFVAEFIQRQKSATSAPCIFNANDSVGSGSDNSIRLSVNQAGTHIVPTIATSGVTQASMEASPHTANSLRKIAFAYAANNAAASGNGASVVSDTSVVLPTVNRLSIGSCIGENFLNGTIFRLTYYPKQLTLLQALSAQ